MTLHKLRVQYVAEVMMCVDAHVGRAASILGISKATVRKFFRGSGVIKCDCIEAEEKPTKTLHQVEEEHIKQAFIDHKYSTVKTAEFLGIAERTSRKYKNQYYPNINGQKKSPRHKRKIEGEIPDIYFRIFPTNEERLAYLDDPSYRWG